MAARSLFFFFVLTLLTVLPEGAASQSVPILDPEGGAIGQCMERIRSIPERAAAVAQKRLHVGELAASQEIAWLGCLGMATSVLGRPAEATASADRMQVLLATHWNELTDEQRFAALRGSGEILQNSGEAGRAVGLLSRAYGLTLTQTSTLRRIHADEAIAVAYLNLDAPDAAEAYILEARELSEGRAPDQPFINYYYGLTLVRLKRYDEAFAVYELPEEHLHDILDAPVLHHRIAMQRAVILGERGDRQTAAALLAAALAQQRAMKDARGEAETQIRLAELQWANGEQEKALVSAQQASALAKQGHYLKEEKDALDLLALIYSNAGSAELAHNARTQADALARSMLNDKKSLDAAIANATTKVGYDAAKSFVRNGVVAAGPFLAVGLVIATFLAAIACIYAWRARRLAQIARELDPLTRLPGRVAAIARFNAVSSDSPIATAARFAALLVCIDKLDSIDDLYGYDISDRVLCRMATQLREVCASKDFVARWSDDSFLAVVESSSCEEASLRAGQLCRIVEQGGIDLLDGDALRISISIGIASFPFFPKGAREDWRDSLRLARRALQSARRVSANSWACIWGLEAKDNCSTAVIAQAPLRSAELGLVRLEASSPSVWQI